MTALSFIALLFVAIIVVRVSGWSSEKGLVSVSIPDALFVPKSNLESRQNLDQIYASVILPEFDMPVVAKVAPTRKIPRVRFMQVNKEVNILDEVFSPAEINDVKDVEGQWRQLQGARSIPSDELVVLKPVEMNTIESTSLVSLMDSVVLPADQSTMVASTNTAPAEEKIIDSVSTKLAKNEILETVDTEPTFFEMPKQNASEQKVETAVNAATTTGGAKAQEENEYSIPEGWDLPVGSQRKIETSIQVDDQLITSGYIAPAGAPRSIAPIKPVVAMNTHGKTDNDYSSPSPERAIIEKSNLRVSEQNEKANVSGRAGSVTVTTYVVEQGQDPIKMAGVEIRAKDDDSQSWRTGKQGEMKGVVTLHEQVANGSYERTIFVNENEDLYVPTYTDIDLSSESAIEMPIFTKDKLAAFGDVNSNVPTGTVLVQLDEATESVKLDGSVQKVLRLNDRFMITKADDYSYLLFLGVEAGNRILTSVQGGNRSASRIIHVHASALTVDHNFYGKDQRLVISLAEEDLMSRKKRPLIISSDQVQQFFTGERAQKLSPSRYAFRSSPTLAGARHYLSLSHQGEDIFVGTDGRKAAVVPSEAFIREVIRRFHIEGSANSCIVQINLDKPAKRYQVVSESYDEAHTSYGLVLDEDGQFYESMGETSRRLFIMSESQTGRQESANARINVRLEYQDGTSRSLHSYCSPNSYLVEQL